MKAPIILACSALLIAACDEKKASFEGPDGFTATQMHGAITYTGGAGDEQVEHRVEQVEPWPEDIKSWLLRAAACEAAKLGTADSVPDKIRVSKDFDAEQYDAIVSIKRPDGTKARLIVTVLHPEEGAQRVVRVFGPAAHDVTVVAVQSEGWLFSFRVRKGALVADMLQDARAPGEPSACTKS